MRILVINNLYPPYFIGGYELGCKDIVDRLKARGHQVRILTSTYGIEGPRTDGEIYRWLEEDFYRWLKEDVRPAPQRFPRNVPRLLKKEARNQRAFKRVVKLFRPDIVYLWNLRGISMSLALLAERTGVPVCYFVSDQWWSRWDTQDGDPWYELWDELRTRQFPNPRALVRVGLRTLKRALRLLGVSPPAPLAFRHIHFTSDFLRRDASEAGKQVAHAEVIHCSIDVGQFSYRRDANNPKRLLYVGQINPLKGFRTAIEAMRLIVKEHGQASAKLTVVGGCTAPNYMEKMQKLIESYGLDEHVEFAGFTPRESLPDIYRQHDILIFPSLLDEAIALVPLEAMSCGLAVVSTATGGNSEVLRHEFNALTFPKEDARTCADHILRLLNDHDYFEKLRAGGRRTVEEGFDIERMVNKIECSLLAAANMLSAPEK